MRLAAILACALSASLLAGCASPPSETQSPPPSPGNSSTNEGNATYDAAFLLEGPVLRDAQGRERDAFHEDDAVTAHYVIALTPTARTGATAFASFLVNGKVVDIQSVHLEPGARKAFDPPIDVRNATQVRVEVKVGAADGKANATVAKWPRVGGTLDLGNATVKLSSWQNATDRIHVELEVGTPVDGSVAGLHVKLLCLNDKGAVTIRDDQAPDVAPGPGVAVPMDFPACDEPYGLALSATEAGEGASGRILFG